MAIPPSNLLAGNMSLSKALSLATAWLDGEDPPLDDAAIISRNSNSTRIEGSTDEAGSSTAMIAQHLQSSTTTPIEKAISLLLEIQSQISASSNCSLMISSNESLEDVSTSSLELLSVTYHLGRAYLMLPTTTTTTSTNNTICNNDDFNSNIPSGSNDNPALARKHNVTTAMEYFHLFLKQLDQLGDGMLSEATLKEYHALLDDEQQDDEEADNIVPGYEDANTISNRTTIRRRTTTTLDPNQLRTMKIQRYQRKQHAQKQKQHLQSHTQRRIRLGLSDTELLDGHDNESLLRSLHLETLRVCAEEALEEISSSMRELEMIEMSIKYSSGGGGSSGGSMGRSGDVRMMDGRVSSSNHSRPTDLSPPQPLQMTQITQNPITGQLQLTKHQVTKTGQLQPLLSTTTTQISQRQQITDGVFRPGWNLPTMSLEELAQREVAEAMQRSEAQKIAEADAIYKPRRYDQLERDGMEDDAKLVEASAQLDREWDSWKEENPRGCGNKLGERGDRNF